MLRFTKTAILPYQIISFFLLMGFSAYCQPSSTNKHIDTLIKQVPLLMRSNEQLARQMIVDLEIQAKKHQHSHGQIQALFFKSWLSYRHDPADTAIQKIDSVLQNVGGVRSDTALVKFYILKGQCFVKKTQFDKALENFKKALQIAELRKDYISKTGVLISIGWAYMEDDKPNEAIRFFTEVLQLHPAENFENRGVVLNNIAACYNTLGNYRQATAYAQKGILTARRTNNQSVLANGLNILARSYYLQGYSQQAIVALKEAAQVREKVADPAMLASDYLELAELYRKNAQPLQTIIWAKKAEAVSEKHGINLKLSNCYEALAAAYEAVGDHQKATAYLKKIVSHKDSTANNRYNQAFAQMQVQYETQKKTAENLQLKQENLEAKLKNSTQQRWLILLIAGIILLTASGFYISRLIKSRYKTQLAVEQLKEQKKRTIAVMEAEEQERRRIAADLHDGVGQTIAAASMHLNKAITGQLSLDKVDELILQAGSEVRSLSHQITPELLIHYGLVKAMEQAVIRLNDAKDRTKFTLFTHINGALENQMVSLTIYRCFQELCSNILKHANATEVTIQLNQELDEVELIVEDNGKGFIVETAKNGLGLKNIQSRISLFDGTIQYDSSPGNGTTSILKIRNKVVEASKTLIA